MFVVIVVIVEHVDIVDDVGRDGPIQSNQSKSKECSSESVV